MINTEEILRQLMVNSDVIRALVGSVSDEQAQWKPDSETWCLQEAMQHLYNEERLDFRMHLKELLNDPLLPWGSGEYEDYITVESCRQALDGFLQERRASLAWLKGLQSPDWNEKYDISFGPVPEIVRLGPGDVLVSWVAHDFLHIRQVNALLYAWHQKQVLPFSVEYAGTW